MRSGTAVSYTHLDVYKRQVVGIVAYLLLGETNVGRRRVERRRKVQAALPDFTDIPGGTAANKSATQHERHAPLFKVGHSISGFAPVGGNSAALMADSDATITTMIRDIDAAEHSVHLLFYIWPVSYTHLDVYKRQSLVWPSPPS